MGVHNRLADAKTQPVAAGVLGAGLINPVKWFKDEGKLPGRNPNHTVDNVHNRVARRLFYGNANRVTFRI